MTADINQRYEWRSVGIICFVVLMAHGLNLLNDGVFWDGWVCYHWIQKNDISRLSQFFNDVGLPAFPAYFYALLGSFGNYIFTSRIVTLCAVLVQCISVYIVISRLRIFSKQECVLCCVVAGSYSAFQILPESYIAWPIFCIMSFYVALLLYQNTLVGMRHHLVWCSQILAMLLFYVSFSVNSVLVYYYVVLIIFHYNALRDRSLKINSAAVVQHGTMYLLPILYWIIKITKYSKDAYFAGYNELIISPAGWFNAILKFVEYSVDAQVSMAISNVIIYPIIIVGALILFNVFKNVDNKIPAKSNAISPYAIFGVGAILFLAAILAYVLVGKAPVVIGTESRHSILVSIPMGILAVGFMRYVTSYNAGNEIGNRIILLCIMVLIMGMIVTNIKNAVEWQVNWIRDVALMQHLGRRPEWKDYSIYLIQDESNVPMVVDYHFAAYAGMFNNVWGGESRTGLDVKSYSTKNEIEDAIHTLSKTRQFSWTIMDNLDTSGKRIYLKIERKCNTKNISIYAKYYYYKYIKPSEIGNYIETLFSVEQIPLQMIDGECQIMRYN